MIKTLIIDDEIRGIKSVEALIRNSNFPIQVVGKALTKKEALLLIEQQKPQLVFLDIEMPPETGFAILEALPKIDFKVIFVTAFQEYAIKAFRFAAIDYLLKPVNIVDFNRSVERVLAIQNQNLQLEVLKGELQFVKGGKIVLPTSDAYHIVSLNEVEYCRAEDNYTFFYFINGSSLIVSKSLKEFDELLSDHHFFRIHKSYLINLKYLNRIVKKEGGYAVMNSETELPISLRKRTELLMVLKNLL